MSTEKPTCGNCPYYDVGADNKGLCRNMIPNVLNIDGDPVTVWPIVDDSDWCGMHPVIRAFAMRSEMTPSTKVIEDTLGGLLDRIGK